MSKSTKQDVMNEIHQKVARSINKRLDGSRIKGEEGEDDIEVGPSDADLALAIKFLKDNSIFSAPEQSDETAEIQKKLAARGRIITDADRKAALTAIGQSMVE